MASTDRTMHDRLIGIVWHDQAEARIYQKAVDNCLGDPDIARRLGKRPAANAEAVRAAMATEPPAARALEQTRETLAKFRTARNSLREVQAEQAARRGELFWDWRSAGSIAITLLFFLFGIRAESGILFWCFVAVLACWLTLACVQQDSRRTLSKAFAYCIWIPLERIAAVDSRYAGKLWATELRTNGVKPEVRHIVDVLLGDDIEELLLADSYEGLRVTASHKYLVSNNSTDKLARKMSQMDGGTIAVCGPRGSGKTTLLEGCVTHNDFAIFMSAPATFTPHDFLLSLFSRLCETYMTVRGFQPPDFTRLKVTHRVYRRIVPKLKKLALLASYALPSFVLIGIGTFATARTLEAKHADAAYSYVRYVFDETAQILLRVWRGESVGFSLLITILGVALWRSRRSSLWSRVAANVREFTGTIVGAALIVVPVITCFRDPTLEESFHDLGEQDLSWLLGVAFAGFLFWLFDPTDVDGEWSIVDIDVSKSFACRVFRLTCIIGALYMIHSAPTLHNIATDDDNPARVLSVLAGVLALRIGEWKPAPGEPQLITRCRNQLYRLHTIQSTTSTLTTGASQIASMGSTHATSITSIPPNFPDLVEEFRNLLSTIAFSRSLQGKRTVIAIDELDRLGDDKQALGFLNEIKAIFGVPHVHYLISVSEDVGAAFVRRGVPHRDATDSSLDDVVHVQPGTLEQSTRVLQKRAPGISDPYIMLVHALSGGITRDLIRYGRRVIESEEKARTGELAMVSRQLIAEELVETLSGFRVLLGRHEWTQEATPFLDSFRQLMQRLRSGARDFEGLVRALSNFVERASGTDGSQEHLQLPSETRRLLMEASAYAYFSLTMLEIFGVEGFVRRRQAAAFMEGGNPQLLAEAKQELGVSPYTAMGLLQSIRYAWNLPVQTRP
ncbi:MULTISPECIES: P-loop NTPase fold protein [Streptomyces]|uniref:P-loop NTPase fold protein n=2 Tax=Streptomyces TaxID=1883 RepID=UPI0014319CCE|nr:P-loop NTPase fold protein [Streptomyces sp. 2BBP-J2]NIL55134.1 hypothetical protein [Streptomyces sp. 2BBP-J2]